MFHLLAQAADITPGLKTIGGGLVIGAGPVTGVHP